MPFTNHITQWERMREGMDVIFFMNCLYKIQFIKDLYIICSFFKSK